MYLFMCLYRVNIKPLSSLQHVTFSKFKLSESYQSGCYGFIQVLHVPDMYCMYLFFGSTSSLTYVPQYQEGVCNFIQLKQLKRLWKNTVFSSRLLLFMWCTLWANQQRAVTSVISVWFPVYFTLLNRPEFKMRLLSVL